MTVHKLQPLHTCMHTLPVFLENREAQITNVSLHLSHAPASTGHYYKHTMKIRKINISNRQSIAIVAEIAKVNCLTFIKAHSMWLKDTNQQATITSLLNSNGNVVGVLSLRSTSITITTLA